MFNLPNPLEVSELEALVFRLRQHDLSVVKKIYESHMRLAATIAMRFARYTPEKKDDLISQAMYALAYALKKAPDTLQDNNITPYIISYIRSFCGNYLQQDNLIHIPGRTKRFKEKQGIKLKEIRVWSYDKLKETYNLDESEDNVCKKQTIRNQRRTEKRLGVSIVQNMLELKELIEKSITSPIEKQLVDFRIQGYTNKEIAEFFSLSEQRIQQIGAKIKERFEQLEKKV